MRKIVDTGIGTTVLGLVAAVLVAGPAPAQTSGTRPAQNPAPTAHPEKAKPAPQPAPQSESDKAKQEEKAKREREEAQAKERAEKERAEKAKTTGTTPPKPGPAPGVKTAPALNEEQREIMKKAAHFEHVHRTRTARINRLIQIYKSKGDEAKVKKLEEMKAKEDTRTTNAMAGFRKRLGEENWGRLNAEMKRHHGRAEHADKEKEKAPGKGDGAR